MSAADSGTIVASVTGRTKFSPARLAMSCASSRSLAKSQTSWGWTSVPLMSFRLAMPFATCSGVYCASAAIIASNACCITVSRGVVPNPAQRVHHRGGRTVSVGARVAVRLGLRGRPRNTAGPAPRLRALLPRGRVVQPLDDGGADRTVQAEVRIQVTLRREVDAAEERLRVLRAARRLVLARGVHEPGVVLHGRALARGEREVLLVGELAHVRLDRGGRGLARRALRAHVALGRLALALRRPARVHVGQPLRRRDIRAARAGRGALRAGRDGRLLGQLAVTLQRGAVAR